MNKVKIENWKVSAFYPYTPILEKSVEVGLELSSIIPYIEAKVPGSVHMDLEKFGYIKNPYFEMNSLASEWIENKWWIYNTKLEKIDKKPNKRYFLLFEGIDFKGHIYFNNINLGTHENMFSPFEVEITEHINQETNDIKVMLESQPDLMGQIGYTSKSKTQKSRYYYKWDFSTRLVNVGLHKPVYLIEKSESHIKDISLHTKVDGDEKSLHIDLKLETNKNKSFNLKFFLNEKEIYKNSVIESKNNFSINVENIELWNPHGFGAQNLYKFKVVLFEGHNKIDEHEKIIGFKKFEMIQNETKVKNALPYTFVVNDKKIYIKGVNITPLDVLLGNVTHERYDKLIKLLVESNINLIRVWGGGVIEDNYFYELCDKFGIMVWQEFIQSSSGIDNVPSENKEFLKDLYNVSKRAIHQIKNHVSLTVYSGGNELTDINGVPATFENKNLLMLKGLVEKYDSERYMFPTSSSGPLAFGDINKPGQNHDIHGSWKYLGSEDHYNFFNKIDSLFHSEFGVDGMTTKKSLKKFLKKSNIIPTNMNENIVWRHHGEWWDTSSRDKDFFGDFKNIEDQILASQFIQMEGLRYALESNRRRAFENSGSVIWQANEPYPNVSCTSLIDYYMEPKLALIGVRNAFQKINPNLSYKKIKYRPGENIHLGLHLSSDGLIKKGKLKVEIKSNNIIINELNYKFEETYAYNKLVEDIVIKTNSNDKSIIVLMSYQTDKVLYKNSVLFLIERNGVCNLKEVRNYVNEHVV